jgi:thioester reductase-like protein
MQELLSVYSQDLPHFSSVPKPHRASKSTSVLLHGSTGFIGSYLLNTLLQNRTVHRIYCLNRSPIAQQRQYDSHHTNGLTTVFPPSRVTFLKTDLNQPNLGLSSASYSDLLANVTHIILNAWPVNWALPLSAFIPNLCATRYFIDLAASSPNRPHLLFLSSISSCLESRIDPVPECIVSESTASFNTGYARSKNLAERLLHAAHTVSGIRTAACRIGTVPGAVLHPQNLGAWNRSEWFPRLVASCRFLGMIPDSLGTDELVHWTPVDILSTVLVELLLGVHEDATSSFSTMTRTMPVYHALNPQLTTWNATLLPAILADWRHERLHVVTLREWVDALAKSKGNGGNTLANPGVKLIGFYRGLATREKPMVRFETQTTAKESRTLAGMSAVKGEWMERWLQQWEGRGSAKL